MTSLGAIVALMIAGWLSLFMGLGCLIPKDNQTYGAHPQLGLIFLFVAALILVAGISEGD
jgi:hypothetical protein